MAKTVTIYKGLPASGKSTHAKDILDKCQGSTKCINKDALRNMLDNGNWSKKNEKFIIRVRNWLIKQALAEGKHILVDDTNLHSSHEEDIRELVKTWNREHDDNVIVKIEDLFLKVTVEECIKRDLKRDASVGEKVIRQMYRQHLKVKGQYEDQSVQRPWLDWEHDKEYGIIIDLDGTLAYLHRNPYKTEDCESDEVNQVIAELIRCRFAYQDSIILVSGRSDKYRDKTEKWLSDNDIVYDHLFMRKEGDNRKDSIIKEEIYHNHIQSNWNIRFVIDDRKKVTQMWRNLNLLVFQVAEGDI